MGSHLPLDALRALLRRFAADERFWPLWESCFGGADGAYAAATDTIYLAEAVLRRAPAAAVLAVPLEEVGHSIDARVNRHDSPGDEGAIFAAVVGGDTLPAAALAELRGEQDRGWLTLDGQRLALEASSPTEVGALAAGHGEGPRGCKR